MSKDWTAAELKAASEAMKHMGFIEKKDFGTAVHPQTVENRRLLRHSLPQCWGMYAHIEVFGV